MCLGRPGGSPQDWCYLSFCVCVCSIHQHLPPNTCMANIIVLPTGSYKPWCHCFQRVKQPCAAHTMTLIQSASYPVALLHKYAEVDSNDLSQVCLSVCLSVCLCESVCASVCVFVDL